MKFVRIFDCNLVAVKYHDTDTATQTYTSEWDKIFKQWKDLTYINNFFNDPNNKKHLASAFYRKKGLTVAKARMQVYQDAIFVRKKIVEICNTIKAGGDANLDEFFKPLTNTEIGERTLQKTKGRKRLIAIYAIRVSSEHYVLTGGAIKLVHLMKDQNETYHQLTRLQTTAGYLKAQGVIDDESFYEFILDES